MINNVNLLKKEMVINELRIGNWIQWEDESNDMVQVKGIGETKDGGVVTTSKKERAYLFEFVGIPLTEEILLKAGFRILTWGYVKISSENFSVRLNPITFNYEVSGNNPVEVKYVHQLQNLIYALTGEELIIQP